MKLRTGRLILFTLASGVLLGQEQNTQPSKDRDAPSPPNTNQTNEAPAKDSPITGPSYVFRVGGKVKPPRVRDAPDPVYPKSVRDASGTVVLQLVVDEKGNPTQLKVARSIHPDLDQAALNAVSKWKFEPGKVDRKPVKVQIVVEVTMRPY